ncbi:OVARIAN TUMOR DOMAIN-containing deubiquitinating enzyme 4-like [Lolium rigidum]|uniref:OVARIAN TUMOR DOMAIN-containing deubiquitinating enzyme 4-like n=1 Tax=Lolium rigidum TaxID=89674 RepID=UPI001F5CB27A|nr:OVARIAN TUMOR DOMAIN-containing deubiquitinating enzyme 4-like [Lolium rigidum]XP_047075182.1 OVARIAN TUMOR DOMAIN-containing deubiquitinating enzyme 4-like [Lolium rigidum]XP_047075190.1 OVARIAN TUMOR DOMAIN-containing deubiquitinating enzyme 4-like [Lolium rigidum]XP_047075197.1 OVARIAN TUMOR DOMAIN-containing deubiquitinating enzyme 4-like [Lolium rigidum]XP_047075203.1 OVARIAN TUMOR DOMAIN-containing deubiquitinating enzyme 4-like [Lolium rigidum]XP_047075210.1 OVARIAN TUMOR DOMAIN-cont
MRIYSPAICLRRSASSNMYAHPNQFQGGVTQSMAIWKCSGPQSSRSHMTSGSASFSFNKNLRPAEPQSLKYFASLVGRRLRCGLSTREGSLSVKLDMLSRERISGMNWNWRGMHQKLGATAGGLCFGFSVTGIAKAEMPVDRNISETSASSIHGKKVYTDYSVTGIPGDGRCLFRSVVHGACVRSGKAIPNEDLQRKLADELRSMVADEFVSRREETEWFVEGDFDTYVSQIRQPHVWGGEPELFMASHVLQMPITVYMRDEDWGGLISIAEYGQEYGKEDPVQLMYHGFGHYDSLQIPANRGPEARM